MTDSSSPYAPPQSRTVDVDSESIELLQASLGRRLANFLLDTVGYIIFAIIVTVAWAYADPAVFDSPVFDFIVSYPLVWVYYVLFEGLTGRTPAKLITGTRVVDANGDKPSFGRILLRSLARFIPFEPFSFFRDGGEGWHDTMTKTHVIRNKPPKES